MKKINLIIFIVIIALIPLTAFADNYTITMEDGLITAGNQDSQSVWQEFILKYKNFITGIAAIGAVTMVLFSIKSFMSLGINASNSQGRKNAILGIWITGIAAALLGATALITGIFYRVFV